MPIGAARAGEVRVLDDVVGKKTSASAGVRILTTAVRRLRCGCGAREGSRADRTISSSSLARRGVCGGKEKVKGRGVKKKLIKIAFCPKGDKSINIRY